MPFDNLLIDDRDAVRTITVNRPDKLNALNRQTVGELQQAMMDADDADEVRVVVITGAGEKAFVAGADISEIREQTAVEARTFSATGQALMSRIQSSEKPVIAAINGFALGGGMELALGCHLRIASNNARLGLPEIKLGIMPGFGGTQRLLRLVGTTRALEMALTGEPVKAERAEQLGIVNRVVEPGELESAVNDLAGQLANAAPEAVRGILQAINQGADTDLQTGLALETARFALCCATEDMQEGTGAFLEKRTPEFKGR
ncbi:MULTISPECIES: enoyl-CoA hydratase/isomerase family protein [unclassified Wenzhouxiangella]|uniref:enoyl-CoA hydratase/isomerase family protein n=1 Tax=unclassified Wenzhouxiangella TaxID=2613841 RepID=UPI000E326FB5|nr:MULTISPECIES: enoyl-CoA hydratase-related protein [unclassified Wenzhouxiangella]RFF27833.1 enoyl-CoA hydratase [Wenzhouxiangella sp. 15181]RFP70323.1 enoyl-CoA hydratase [Wenzhouxiangella sp. 15190]